MDPDEVVLKLASQILDVFLALEVREEPVEYLFQEKEISDPEDRFGEEAVESAAARALSAWPSEAMLQALLQLSGRRMLSGLIAALAEYRHPEAIPYFERALEDDFYRPAAENAFRTLGKASLDALVRSATKPLPSGSLESPSSLERRRSALRLLNDIGMTADHWPAVRPLIHEPDPELIVAASRLGLAVASKDDRLAMAHRLLGLLSAAPWHLQEHIKEVLVALEKESAPEIDDEIRQRLEQPESVRGGDERLRALLSVKHRFEQAGKNIGNAGFPP